MEEPARNVDDVARIRRGPSLQIDVYVGSQDLAEALRQEAKEGLAATPKRLSPMWLYDDYGSQLFEQITQLPEYYLSRAERSILEQRAGEIARLTRAPTLVELGSGTSEKTRLLIEALRQEGTLERFVPLDVSAGTLRQAAIALVHDYPDLAVHAVVGDFTEHLSCLPSHDQRLVVFLGSTLGNSSRMQRHRLLRALGRELAATDSLLLGLDLVKDVDRLEAAYNDSAGVTAEFNKNALRVLNSTLGASFDTDAFEHVARWDEQQEHVAMFLKSTRDQQVRIDDIDMTVEFSAGELLHTSTSCKFRREGIERELETAGLSLVNWWTDDAGDFALARAIPA